jgi:small GTP-binding protein
MKSIREEQQEITIQKIRKVIENQQQSLNLSDSALDNIPPEVFQIKDLVYLELSNSQYCDDHFKNNIRVIPPEIKELQKLRTLKINNNLIETLPPDICKLINLKTVELENNRIKELPSDLVKIKTLSDIKCSNNPFENIPPEIASKSLDAIRNFFKEIEEKDYLYEVKLLLVGEGRVGKTTLSKALRNPEYYSSNDEQSTEGINVQQLVIPKNEFSKFVLKDFILNIWDFGGQEIYHATHQFFLTKRSLYLLVTESRKEDRHDDFYYWLNIIKLLGDKSPVIIVMNKCDQPTKELPIKEYQDTFDNIITYCKVSCKQDKKSTLESLKDEIKTIITNNALLPHIGTALPKKWVDIRMELDTLKKEGKDYISLDEYLSICKRHYRNQESALYLSEYFHDLGVILHFQKDLDLRDTIVLNNEWVTKGVYKILDNQKIIDNHGRFTNDNLLSIWSEESYKNKTKELISLMKNQKFELCFELGNGEYLAPQLLPVDEIAYEWRTRVNNLQFEFLYKFMPKGILPRTIVKRNKDIYNKTYWRYGVLLHYDNTRAIIREKYLENKITITLEGDHKKEFLSIIRKTINEIHSDFNNLEVAEMIPCNCDECKNTIKPDFQQYTYLRRLQQKGIPTVRCHNSLNDVKVASLIDDVIVNDDINDEQKSSTTVNINSPGVQVTVANKIETDEFTQKK